jgi:hypothetical protein
LPETTDLLFLRLTDNPSRTDKGRVADNPPRASNFALRNHVSGQRIQGLSALYSAFSVFQKVLVRN